MKASNYSQAIKEVGELDKSQLNKVVEEIKENEKGHFHVITVKVETRPGEAKNKVTINKVALTESSFKKLEKNFAFLGFAKIVLLHDPRTNNKANPSSDSTDLVAKHKEQLDKTVDELKAFAEANEIDLSGLKNKAEIQVVIATWLEEQSNA